MTAVLRQLWAYLVACVDQALDVELDTVIVTCGRCGRRLRSVPVGVPSIVEPCPCRAVSGG